MQLLGELFMPFQKTAQWNHAGYRNQRRGCGSNTMVGVLRSQKALQSLHICLVQQLPWQESLGQGKEYSEFPQFTTIIAKWELQIFSKSITCGRNRATRKKLLIGDSSTGRKWSWTAIQWQYILFLIVERRVFKSSALGPEMSVDSFV